MKENSLPKTGVVCIIRIILNCILITFLVDESFVARQKQVLSLLAYYKQSAPEAEWYKIAHDYDIEANIDNYTVRISRFINSSA